MESLSRHVLVNTVAKLFYKNIALKITEILTIRSLVTFVANAFHKNVMLNYTSTHVSKASDFMSWTRIIFYLTGNIWSNCDIYMDKKLQVYFPSSSSTVSICFNIMKILHLKQPLMNDHQVFSLYMEISATSSKEGLFLFYHTFNSSKLPYVSNGYSATFFFSCIV